MNTLKHPVLADNVYIAPGAIVRGNVTLMEHANIWFHAVLRAETGTITVGCGSNIQDGCVVHVDELEIMSPSGTTPRSMVVPLETTRLSAWGQLS